MFMRVKSKCAHQVRPPPGPDTKERGRWWHAAGFDVSRHERLLTRRTLRPIAPATIIGWPVDHFV